MLHVTPEFPCIVGDFVTIGHRAVVHACRLMNNVGIGSGAVVLDGAVVEEGAQVGAGALVPPGKIVPAGWLVMGVPAKPVCKMDAAELEDILKNARDYIELSGTGTTAKTESGRPRAGPPALKISRSFRRATCPSPPGRPRFSLSRRRG